MMRPFFSILLSLALITIGSKAFVFAEASPEPSARESLEAENAKLTEEVEKDSGMDGATMTLFVSWLEGFLPAFVQTFSNRLAAYMSVVGERQVAKRYTDQELEIHVVKGVESQFSGQVKNAQVHIDGDGFVGSGVVTLGSFRYQMKGRAGIVLEGEEMPHLVIHELWLGGHPIPAFLVKRLETRVNDDIDRQYHPIRVQDIELHTGSAYISVEAA